MKVEIPVSPEQEEVLADYLLSGGQLGMQPDERAWILSQVRAKYSGQRVLGADLDLETATWTLTLSDKQ